MKRNIALLFFMVVIGSFAGCGSEETVERPNILWITSEDNSPFLGAYGDPLAVTPNLDRLADRGIVYENAFATTPVCAPSRFTLITGLYANAMGTENMRSTFPLPEEIRFYPEYLKEAGYHTTNNVKKDYNTIDRPQAWDESSDSATYETRASGQPFFHIRNFTTTHESRLHDPIDTLRHDPNEMSIPAYQPETDAIKTDWAHYYDQVTMLDSQAGQVLEELEASGEAENTIVFYYSDHGGALPRGKRFMFESGLHVPLIIYMPPKFAHLDPGEARTDRLVSFVDFPATLLSLAGIEPPEYMHGSAFLGEYAEEPRDYVHMYRGRMDERFDLVRGLRDKEYLYIRNFMPNRIYGQHLWYLWQAPSMQSWHEAYLEGTLSEEQSQFFEPKPAEELYEIASDPDNVHNLAGDPEYRDVLVRMRQANAGWMRQVMDLGFIPEEMIDSIRGGRSLYDAVREQGVPVGEIIETAEAASMNAADNLEMLVSRLDHPDSAVRFWAATGFAVSESRPDHIEPILMEHADDPSVTVRIAVAEALYLYGNRDTSLEILKDALDEEHPLVKLRSLNTIEALNITTLPSVLVDKIRQVRDAHSSGGGTNTYINRTAISILGE